MTTSDHSSVATLKPADLLTFVQAAKAKEDTGHLRGTSPQELRLLRCYKHTAASAAQVTERNKNALFTAHVVKAGTNAGLKMII